MFDDNTFDAALTLAQIALDPKKFQANINSLKSEREACKADRAEVERERAAWAAEKAAQETELAARDARLKQLCEFVQARETDAERAHAVIAAEPARLVQMERRLRTHLMRLLGYDDTPIRSEQSLEQLMAEATGVRDAHYDSAPAEVKFAPKDDDDPYQVDPGFELTLAAGSTLTRSQRSIRSVDANA